MKIEIKNIADLKKTEKNVRIHTSKQIEEYARSIKMFGQIRPIVCDEHGEIFCGNGMYDALVSIGSETAECYVMENLTDVQKKKLMLADNKIFEMGHTSQINFEEIINELDKDFDVPGYDADILSLIANSVDNLTTDIQEAVERESYIPKEDIPELPKEKNAIAGNNTESRYEPVRQSPEIEPEERFIICPKCGEKIAL